MFSSVVENLDFRHIFNENTSDANKTSLSALGLDLLYYNIFLLGFPIHITGQHNIRNSFFWGHILTIVFSGHLLFRLSIYFQAC